ncbi:MAG: glycosyltransferase [Candidatus Pacebacteria bacterium]|nr:glycosyltransferase [Candidatus Paceibacterota bacterium]
MAKKPSLTLIILNYNTQFWLKKTLTSLNKHYRQKTQTKLSTVVVDNASEDQSVAMVKKEFPWVKLMALPKNLGYATANNLALKKVQTDYCMLLNSDVEFTAATKLDQLIKFLADNPKIAVITPRVELENGKLDWACHRGEPTPWASLTYFAKLEKLCPQRPSCAQYHQKYKDLNTIHEIDACSGAAMMVKTAAMKKVGFLDERFFIYAEDLDWCKRFRDAGYQVAYHPLVKIIHHKYKAGLESRDAHVSFETKRHFYNTMLQYYDKHYREHYPELVRWLLRVVLFIKRGGF